MAIIQARLNSARLPGKALRDLVGQPLLRHVIDRALMIPGVEKVVLATHGERDALALWIQQTPIPDLRFGTRRWHEVAEDDVLERFVMTVQSYEQPFDTIMRLTGDCPFLDPYLCADVLEAYRLWHEREGVEYVSNVHPGYLDGTDCEVFSREALMWAAREATSSEDREHVTPWLRRHVKCRTLVDVEDYAWLKVSIDTEEELHQMRALVRYLAPGAVRRADTVAAAHAAGLFPVESL